MASDKPDKITLVEVAQHAGVSLGSASRAMNGEGASPAMVERVRAAAKELGYRPDASGKTLRMGRTKQIAFAVADIGNPVYVEMLSAIHATVAPQGFRVVVMSTGETAASTAELVRTMSTGVVDAMIVSPLRSDDALIEEFTHAPVPIVVIGRALDAHGIDSVSTDSAAAIGLAVEHVRSLGRTRIGFVNGPLDTTPGSARQRGFLATVAATEHDSAIIEIAEDFTVAAGLAAARTLLANAIASGRALDAVVAANDLLAIGVIRAAHERGIRVPDDLAVTGVDNTEISAVFHPSITSVSLGSAERARAAAELVLDRVNPHTAEIVGAQRVHIGPTLIARASTGAPDPMLTYPPSLPTPAVSGPDGSVADSNRN